MLDMHTHAHGSLCISMRHDTVDVRRATASSSAHRSSVTHDAARMRKRGLQFAYDAHGSRRNDHVDPIADELFDRCKISHTHDIGCSVVRIDSIRGMVSVL